MNFALRKWLNFIGVLIVIGLITYAFYLSIIESNYGKEGYQIQQLSDAYNQTNIIDWPNQKGHIFVMDKKSTDQYLRLCLSPNDTYQIEFLNGQKSNSIVINSGKWADITDSEGYKPILHLIPDYIASKGYDKIIITPINGDGEYGYSDLLTITAEAADQYRDGNVIDFEIKQLEVNIDEDDYAKLEKKREEAIDLGILFTDDSDCFSADVKSGGMKYKAELRLKGDLTDHLQGDQCSFRIELKGDYCINGLQKFSIQPIETRNGIWEYLIYEMYREQGGVALRYDFTDVFVNGVYKGVYALEESMEKRVIENSLKREGPIVKISEDLYWERRAYFDGDTRTTDLLTDNIGIFSEKKSLASSTLSGYAAYAITAMNKVFDGEAKMEDVFDVDLYTRLNAIRDLFGAWHGRAWNNSRYYYNPVTGLLEPIPYDELAFEYTRFSINYDFLNDVKLYTETDCNEVYKKYLLYYSDEFPYFIERYQDQINRFETIIKRDSEDYDLDLDWVYNRRYQINELLNVQDPVVQVTFNKADNSYQFKIVNNNWINVTIEGINQGDTSIIQLFNEKFPIVLKSAKEWDVNECSFSIPGEAIDNFNNLSLIYDTRLTPQKSISIQ